MRLVLGAVFGFFGVSSAMAQGWSVAPLDPSAYPPELIAEQGAPAPDGLPDGLVATSESGDIRAAWYIQPTTRYRHAILGDAVEAGGLRVALADGQELSLELPDTQVFEDRTPRLADLDGDGRIEIVTIRASIFEGGSVAVYGVADGTLVERGTTGYIGLSNRWLNVAGIADFLGEDGLQIAHVRTPHIGGTLIVHRFTEDGLAPVADLYGFSNHVIGDIEQRLSAVVDIDGDGRVDLAIPSRDRRALRFVAVDPSGLREIATVPVPGRINKAILAEGAGESLRFVVGLSDGSVVAVSRQP